MSTILKSRASLLVCCSQLLCLVHFLQLYGCLFLADGAEELPSTLLWAWYFYAQHLDYVGRYKDAMVFLGLIFLKVFLVLILTDTGCN
jgi:hypothetical protein